MSSFMFGWKHISSKKYKVIIGFRHLFIQKNKYEVNTRCMKMVVEEFVTTIS
jgi:hypothetical protein